MRSRTVPLSVRTLRTRATVRRSHRPGRAAQRAGAPRAPRGGPAGGAPPRAPGGGRGDPPPPPVEEHAGRAQAVPNRVVVRGRVEREVPDAHDPVAAVPPKAGGPPRRRHFT